MNHDYTTNCNHCHHLLLLLLQKPTFEAIFDLNPGGGDYVNFENGETELQARWKTVAKPRMVQDLQNDSEGPDQGLSATALTIAFLEKKLENRPVLEQQIVIKVNAFLSSSSLERKIERYIEY